MAKIQSPLLGYNNNVRHKNRVFHIQTEDSGVKHPHVITHLFMDGGRILKSVKKSYADHVGEEGLQDLVRQMMKEQHKAMFIALRDGQFDPMFEPAAEGSIAQSVPSVAAGAADAVVTVAVVPPEAHVPSVPPPSTVRLPPTPSRTPTLLGTQTIPAPSPFGADLAPMRGPEATIPDDVLMAPRRSQPPAARRSDPPHVEVRRSLIPASMDLPPPPAAMFQPKAAETGRYTNVPTKLEEAGPVAPTPTAAAATPSPKPAEGPTRAEGGRYAPARPAAIFGQTPPRQSSIFGEDLISDKSLDEVILSYLAEDLEAEKK